MGFESFELKKAQAHLESSLGGIRRKRLESERWDFWPHLIQLRRHEASFIYAKTLEPGEPFCDGNIAKWGSEFNEAFRNPTKREPLNSTDEYLIRQIHEILTPKLMTFSAKNSTRFFISLDIHYNIFHLSERCREFYRDTTL